MASKGFDFDVEPELADIHISSLVAHATTRIHAPEAGEERARSKKQRMGEQGKQSECRRRVGVWGSVSCHGLFRLFISFVGLSCLSFILSLFPYISLLRDRPGGGRGSWRGPLADCSRSQRTVNRKGLCIISS